MTDKLTLKKLKADLDELRAEVMTLDPMMMPPEGPLITDAVSISEFERLEDSLREISARVDGMMSKDDGGAAVDELREALDADIREIGSDVERYRETITELRQKVETLEEELAQAQEVVTGLRATADTDATAKEAQDRKVADMRKQMESIFERMVKNEQKVLVNEDSFKRFQRERRNESTLLLITAAFAAGVSLVILAVALAGLI